MTPPFPGSWILHHDSLPCPGQSLDLALEGQLLAKERKLGTPFSIPGHNLKGSISFHF